MPCYTSRLHPYIRAMAQRKQCLWRFHSRDPTNQQLCDRYKQTAKEYKSAVYNYELSKEKQIVDTGNTGAFYNYINRKLCRQQSIGILENNGQYVTSDVGKAELLNSYFSSVNVQDDGNNPVFHRRVADSISIDTAQFT